MPFYLRKGLNFGPIRVNLSKSGLGFSAGVKGARIGINSQGRSYVHGGRHGLYYRKQLGSIRGNDSFKGDFSRNQLETEDIFTDTGLSFPQLAVKKESVQLPTIPANSHIKILYAGIGLIFIALFIKLIWVKAILGLLGVAFTFYHLRAKKTEKKFHKALLTLTQWETSEMNAERWNKTIENMNPDQAMVLGTHALPAWLEKQVQEEKILDIKQIKSFVSLDPEAATAIAVDTYRDVVEQLLPDHQLSEAEEAFIKLLEDKWHIPQDDIQKEQKLIKRFQRLREIQLQELPEITFSRDLVRGEKAYFEGDGRLLNLRVLNSWQQNRVRYREMGYVLDMEGKVRISSRVLEIQEGRNSRSYPIRQVQDIHLSVEEGVIEVYLSNRKNPLIISSPELFEMAGILNRVSEMDD